MAGTRYRLLGRAEAVQDHPVQLLASTGMGAWPAVAAADRQMAAPGKPAAVVATAVAVAAAGAALNRRRTRKPLLQQLARNPSGDL